MNKELIEKDVLKGGCGRSAEELEFSAVGFAPNAQWDIYNRLTKIVNMNRLEIKNTKTMEIKNE